MCEMSTADLYERTSTSRCSDLEIKGAVVINGQYFRVERRLRHILNAKVTESCLESGARRLDNRFTLGTCSDKQDT